MALELQPMRAGELLDRTFSTLRNHFPLFLGIAALPIVVGVLLPLPFTPASVPAGPRSVLAALPFFIALAIGYAFVLLPATVGTIASAVAGLTRGEAPTIRNAWTKTGRHIPSLIGSVFLMFLVVSGSCVALLPAFLLTGILVGMMGPFGILLSVVFGAAGLAFVVWVALGLALAQPAVVLENAGPLTSLKRSWELARNGRWRILLVYLLYVIISFVVKLVVNVPFAIMVTAAVRHGGNPIWAMVTSNWVGILTSLLILPVFAIGLTLEYFNQRIRKEGFDLQVMMGSLSSPATSPVPGLEPLAGAEPPSSI